MNIGLLIPTRLASYQTEELFIELLDKGNHYEVRIVTTDADGSHDTSIAQGLKDSARYLFAESVVKAMGYRGVR